MRTISLVPSHVGVHIGERHDRPVGVMTLVGSGEFSEMIFEIVLDQPALAAVEAALGEVRLAIRTATVEH